MTTNKTQNTKNSLWLNLVIAIFSVAVVAVIASLLANRNTSWYNLLARPSEWPQTIVFPIVWTCIYALIAVVLFFQLQSKKMDIASIVLLSLNGIFNILWCLCFFTLNSTIGGLIFIILNLFSAILLICKYYKINKIWGYISLIYPLWVAFAFTLNLAVWILN